VKIDQKLALMRKIIAIFVRNYSLCEWEKRYWKLNKST